MILQSECAAHPGLLDDNLSDRLVDLVHQDLLIGSAPVSQSTAGGQQGFERGYRPRPAHGIKRFLPAGIPPAEDTKENGPDIADEQENGNDVREQNAAFSHLGLIRA
jgi:hypothetical protein